MGCGAYSRSWPARALWPDVTGLIARLRRQLGLRCRQKRSFKATTDSAHAQPVAPNMAGQRFEPSRPNELSTVDLTYIATDEGWLYLAEVKDVFTCEIVGYAMGSRMSTERVSQALLRAVRHKCRAVGLVHHSDRGSQYCAQADRQLQQRFGIISSMSRRGNCFDNGTIESFWSSLKNELVHPWRFATRTQAEAAIREYIEIFYNGQQLHSRLSYVAPTESAQRYRATTQTA